MIALYIGRFQPFHKGHLKTIEIFCKKYSTIIVGIGSSQYSYSYDNPFTSKERKDMIISSLENKNIINYKVVEIPDIHNYSKWVSHVESIVTDFNFVITNSPIIKKLFFERGYKIEEVSMYNRKIFSGKEIRRKMINDLDWESAIPKPAIKVIKKINGINRMKNLYYS
jgi:nicotinamide-nucleotide adenylyltransferase